jgi:hypothetical protein
MEQIERFFLAATPVMRTDSAGTLAARRGEMSLSGHQRCRRIMADCTVPPLLPISEIAS